MEAKHKKRALTPGPLKPNGQTSEAPVNFQNYAHKRFSTMIGLNLSFIITGNCIPYVHAGLVSYYNVCRSDYPTLSNLLAEEGQHFIN